MMMRITLLVGKKLELLPIVPVRNLQFTQHIYVEHTEHFLKLHGIHSRRNDEMWFSGKFIEMIARRTSSKSTFPSPSRSAVNKERGGFSLELDQFE